MENIDYSIQLLERYFRSADKKMTITLKNGACFTGYIVGYAYEDMDSDNRSVELWNFLEESMVDENPENDIDDSQIIYQKDILSVYFFESDKTLLIPQNVLKKHSKSSFLFSLFRKKR